MSLSSEQIHVQSFWNIEACGSHFITNFKNERDFFDQYREFRYRTEWHIPLLIPFAEAKDKALLEIGCGNGADGVMFALNGANYTGVDLTQTAVDATRKHFAVMGLPGQFSIDNAEHLSFEDESFDIVYSWGVLHHTPNPTKAIQEVFRVLKKGGKAIIMLYHKHSFNYYVRILLYMRSRLLLRILKRLGRWEADKKQMDPTQLHQRKGGRNLTYQLHYWNFLQKGWSYLASSNFVHHCTDGPECPYAYVFSRKDIAKLFADFKGVQMRVAHFPMRKYNVTRWVPFFFEKFIAFKLGWNLIIYADKQA